MTDIDVASESSIKKMANLLALYLTQGRPRIEQVQTLARAGYSNRETAELLACSESSVRGILFRAKKATVDSDETS